MLSIKKLNYSYGSSQVLSEMNFELQAGQVVALIGPNGSGKSTLLKVIAGILPLPRGTDCNLTWDNESLSSLPLHVRAQKIVYLGADLPYDFPLSVFEAVMMGHIPHHPAVSMTHSEVEVKRVREAMEKAGCLNLEHRLIRELSSGEQQLVAIARAIVQASPVIFLDETLSRMDLHHQMHVGKLLREFAGEGKLILLVSHDLNLSSEWSDSAVLMFEGKLTYYGKLKEALTEGNLKSLYPHTPLLVSLNPSSEAPKVFLNLKI